MYYTSPILIFDYRKCALPHEDLEVIRTMDGYVHIVTNNNQISKRLNNVPSGNPHRV